MGALILDTSIAGFVIRRDSRLALYEPHYRDALTIVSFQTVAELRFGATVAGWGARRRASMERQIGRYLVFPYTSSLADTWADVMTHARRRGRRLGCGDSRLAKPAIAYTR